MTNGHSHTGHRGRIFL